MNPNHPTNHDDSDKPLAHHTHYSSKASQISSAQKAAADLVRQKVAAAYANEPDALAEATEVVELGRAAHRSKHQKYVYDLTTSGKSLAEIQTAWHQYYAGLPDDQKHQVWQEFYTAQAQLSHHPATAGSTATSEVPAASSTDVRQPKRRPKVSLPVPTKRVARTMADLRNYVMSTNTHKARKLKSSRHVQSVLFGLGVGSIVLLIFLFGFFNERFIAPLIQPSRSTANIPLISQSAAATTSPEIIIPKINVEIPVVYDVGTINEAAVETALENGVVHYADSALPGQNGNVVIVGHSSNNIFNKGRYKFAFVLLSRLESGDTFYLQKDGKRYTYQVYRKSIVNPNDVSVLAAADKPATATLITCDPPGTSINRLVVLGQQLDPNPIANAPQTTNNSLAASTAIIPGNAPSLWSRFTKWLSH